MAGNGGGARIRADSHDEYHKWRARVFPIFIHMINNRRHWEQVYATRSPEQVSWTQEKPVTSLAFIHSFHLPKTARIIDVGGGDSKLVDHLIKEGYSDISVLDISGTAIEKAKKRLGPRAAEVTWIQSDITHFKPKGQYDLWHDRATFHFLTTLPEIRKYLETARKAVKGFLTIATFSDRGPDRCSGLKVKKYDEASLTDSLNNGFSKIKCVTENHKTPSGANQEFLFCSFRKKKND